MVKFQDHERRLLLAQPGIGPTVIARIEATGIHSLEALQLAGVPSVVERVCLSLGSAAWSNRRSALVRALAQLASGADVGGDCGPIAAGRGALRDRPAPGMNPPLTPADYGTRPPPQRPDR
jgi:hypothetical protein